MDVGSNSVHLLVAEVEQDGLRPIRDESVLLGLAEVVQRENQLPLAVRQQVLGSLVVHHRAAAVEGAQWVTFVGTYPLRRASNGAELAVEVMDAFDTPLHVLSENDEAMLTYLGVTAGRRPAEPTLIVDIGGGSTEVVVAPPGKAPQVHSLPSGSARLANGIVLNDPITPNELDRLRVAARSLLTGLPAGRVTRAIFVGGTATNLVKLGPLSAIGLEQAHGLLTSLSREQLMERYMLNERRASQLPAGAAILEALLAHFDVAEATASETSLRDGAILARARLGEDWPAHVAELTARA